MAETGCVLQLELPLPMPFQPNAPINKSASNAIQKSMHTWIAQNDKERAGAHAPRPSQTLTFTLLE